MVNNEIINYINQARKGNLTDEIIKSNLLNVGWNETDINESFSVISGPQIPHPQMTQSVYTQEINNTQKVRTAHTMWDVFEHILLFITLYTMASSLAFLLHGFADEWFPKVTITNDYYSQSFYVTLITASASALIVSFPLFAFLFLDVTKRTQRSPELRSLLARRFFIYVTLFITFLILLYKTIMTVYDLLNGNITLNFLLHFIITIGVTGIIFGYYINQIKEDRKLNV